MSTLSIFISLMKYYDPVKKELICIEKEATADFWDEHWEIGNNLRGELRNTKKTFVLEITRKYLKPEDGVILEGGCGMAINVAALLNNGYKCIGVDYGRRTVNALNQHMPELDIRFGDVRKLPFSNDSFIGYWSWGVIEHFWKGYQDVVLEVKRVLKDNGYFFLVFPHTSALRKLKAKIRMYNLWRNETPENFYQFILNGELVIKDCERTGLKLVKAIPFDGIKGAKNELLAVRSLLHRLYLYKGNNVLIKTLRKGLDVGLAPFAGHSLLLIFKKRELNITSQ